MKYDVSKFDPAFNTVDIVLMSVLDNELGVLLIKRKEDPFKDSWALPGGFLDVKTDEDALSAASRELKEETGVDQFYLEQLYTFSKKFRDPREKIANREIRIISIAHYALIKEPSLVKAGSDAKEAKWFKISNLPSLAFDHKEIINKALERVRGKVSYSNIGFELAPKEFTIPQLQAVFEKVLGEKLDRNNFRTKLLKLKVLTKTKKRKKDSVGKPTYYYKLNYQKLLELKGRSLF